MNFKVSENEIRRLRYMPLYTFMAVMVLVLFVILSYMKGKNSTMPTNIIQTITILALVISAAVYFINRQSIAKARSHLLIVNSEGLTFRNYNSTKLVHWDSITQVHVLYSKKNIRWIILETKNDGKINISIYNDMHSLNTELKKYLNENLWNIE